MMPIYLTPGTPDLAVAGPLSVALDGLRTLISNVPAFQTWTGTADAAHALLRVFTGEVGYPIASIQVAAGVITITTREPHMINAADVISIEGAASGAQGDLGIDGAKTVVSVTSTVLTMATALADLATVYPDQAFIVPCPRPLAVVCESADGVHSSSIGGGGASIYSGTVEILLEADVSTAYQSDSKNALYEARNAFGNFVQGLAVTQGTGDLMWLNKIEPVSGPEFTAKPEQDDNTKRFERWRALVRVTWGLDG